MFKNKIVLLLFVIYITIAFAEYNNSEDSEDDVNHEHQQTVNEVITNVNYFPGGFMNAQNLHEYIKKFLPTIAEGITTESCDSLIQKFAKLQPDKGLTEVEYVHASSLILDWIYYKEKDEKAI
ncbi:uncharacterized protein LOC126901562 isoform X2 [Daktulosphaira vitifoliae]|uniref:uncharacterized protein LOC126901562 isoform X2 n=1 Tax=Daktulosphaira vitifoliae TaxID=58002 RepID=UPI0021AA2084|nr:uncharacterized protein LOC126901562 isoform X2 [Daktulosphaira vitifoliae]